MKFSLSRRIAAEFLGTGFLVAAVVGSGIMGERLSGGNVAIALLANTIATGAALAALILAFLPISGAHLNPVVSMAEALRGGFAWNEAGLYVAAQSAEELRERPVQTSCLHCPRFQFRIMPERARRYGSVNLLPRSGCCW